MAKRGFFEAAIEEIVANPTRGTFELPASDIVENCGYASDGRHLTVVTNRVKTLVMTVIEQ